MEHYILFSVNLSVFSVNLSVKFLSRRSTESNFMN